MAEKDACLAIENTVEQLEQAPAIVQVTHELRSLKPGFRTMRYLVEELEGQEYEPDEWLQQVRSIAYETQDVIGSVVADTSLQKKKSKLRRLFSGGKETKHVEDIENMKERIDKICKSKDVANSNKESNYGRSFSKTNDVAVFQDAKETLVKQLMDGAKEQREGILILGKAGSGKTTLAKMVYNDDLINEHFGCKKLVSFTQKLPLEEMLRSILEQTGSSSTQIDSLDKLKLELSKSFKGKRYFVAIDNVHNHEVLDEIITSFPDELNQSRILLTSQVSQADLQGQQSFSFSYTVQPLDANQSWQLFSNKVLEGGSSANLESLGKQMTDKCKGSPGAIIALAEVLKGAEKTEEMWSKFLDGNYDLLNFSSLSKEQQLCLQYFREEKTEEMWSKFTESYGDNYEIRKDFEQLQNDLQFCLLYFGLIPAGLKMPVKQMIQMWMAEGLLKQKGNKRPEEIGEQYLKTLINESFIQVTKSPDARVKTWSKSSNVYHFCRAEGVNWKFSEVHKEGNLKPQKDIPRMAIHSDSVTDVLKSFGNCSHVHSLHCFGENTTSKPIRSAEFWRILHQNFQNLQLLNLGCLELDKVPKELGKMTNLRYLRLKAPNVKHLPSSIVSLHWLETLDMRESHFVSLPDGIWKMQLLRHLYFGGSAFLPNTCGIDYYKTLPNLQTLSGVKPDKELKWLLVRAKFPNVSRLRICSFDSTLTLNFLNSLDHLYYLQSLRMENQIKLPDINAFPLNLTKLTLLKTKLNLGYMNTVGKLPNLRILKLLEEAILGKVIESAGGFLQLEFLHVENLPVENWKLERGAMKSVKLFSIKGHGIDLETAPDYLKKAQRKYNLLGVDPKCSNNLQGKCWISQSMDDL